MISIEMKIMTITRINFIANVTVNVVIIRYRALIYSNL